jgi:hypothetical protein
VTREQDDYEYCLRKIEALSELMPTFNPASEYGRVMLGRCRESMHELIAEARTNTASMNRAQISERLRRAGEIADLLAGASE